MSVAAHSPAELKPDDALADAARPTSMLSDMATLVKLRLTGMVVITTLVGFFLGSGRSVHWLVLLAVGLGTWLLAGSASALNQWWETGPDSLMLRTRMRPLPTGRLTRSTALLLAIFTGTFGAVLLLVGTNALVCGMGLANLVIYAFIYTPLKRITTLNTLVGAVCGGIPPLMGYAAATGHLALSAWLLAGILFIWQIPHFLALSWMYKDDYARAGFRMLPMRDPRGVLTANMAVLYSLLLLPISVALTLLGSAGAAFAAIAAALGTALVLLAIGFRMQRTRTTARRLFLASVIYLPLLLGALVIDRVPHESHTTGARHPLVLHVTHYY